MTDKEPEQLDPGQPEPEEPEQLDLRQPEQGASPAAAPAAGEREKLDIGRQAEETSKESVAVRKQLTPLQWAGFRLVYIVGIFIGLMTLIVGLDWVFGGPPLPTNIPADSQDAKSAIDNWKALREAEWDRSRQMFEVIVQGALVPLFTLLLGYIFGTQTAQAQQ